MAIRQEETNDRSEHTTPSSDSVVRSLGNRRSDRVLQHLILRRSTLWRLHPARFCPGVRQRRCPSLGSGQGARNCEWRCAALLAELFSLAESSRKRHLCWQTQV
jgi:hypothetical protein